MVNQKRQIMLWVGILGILAGYLFFVFHRFKVTQTRSMLGTQVSVTVLVKKKAQGLRLVEGGFQEIARLEKIYSDRLADSELVRINQQAAKNWVNVSQEMADILNDAFYWHKKTGGLFDITVGALGELWGFKSGTYEKVPTVPQVHSVLKQVGMQQVEWDAAQKRIIFKNSKIRLDLGGIAKLAILRGLDDYYKQQKVYQYLINLGGDVLAGQRGPIRKWKIGISNPEDPSAIITQLALEDSLVLTSGDYFREFSHGRKKYHHIIDPRTGFPRETMQAATIIMSNLQPDPIPSIVLFLLGTEKALELLESIPKAEGLLLKGKKWIYSSGFQEMEIK
ncbi:FAD:protein FMN transferase [bacterium]|nr:FAD:protein FMN transferase [bacterium]